MFKSAVLCVALAGTTASSVWLWHQWRNEREANVQLLARLATRQPEPRKPAPPPVATIAAPPASPTKVNLPAEAAVPDWRPDFRDGQRRLLANPEYRKSLRDRQRFEIEYAYRDLPKVLNLSAEQTNRLFDLMADQGVRLTELQSGWPATQVDGKSLPTMTAELRKQNDTERGELLGDRNLQQLKNSAHHSKAATRWTRCARNSRAPSSPCGKTSSILCSPSSRPKTSAPIRSSRHVP
jgi:hypothetical protein